MDNVDGKKDDKISISMRGGERRGEERRERRIYKEVPLVSSTQRYQDHQPPFFSNPEKLSVQFPPLSLSIESSLSMENSLSRVPLHVEGVQEECPSAVATPMRPQVSGNLRRWRWWLVVSISVVFILSGSTTTGLLGRFYFDKGGNSKWLTSLLQNVGFPILIPLYLFHSSSSKPTSTSPQPPTSTLALIYTFFGLLIVANAIFYAYGLAYLPLSTYSLLCSTQLAFNAVFSYFINRQKLTPLILNSVVLLTFSAVLLAVEPVSESSTHSRIPPGKYVIGFLCTLAASALYSLLFSLIQLTFQKVLKKESISAVLEVQIYPSLVATCGGIVGLFASGEWRDLKGEMENFEKGKVGYVMTVVWIAVASQVFLVGSIMLIFEVSSLFCNVIGTLGMPIIPIFAFIFFHDGIGGIKIVSILLAIWGFLSYICQQYLDDSKASKSAGTKDDEIGHASA